LHEAGFELGADVYVSLFAAFTLALFYDYLAFFEVYVFYLGVSGFIDSHAGLEEEFKPEAVVWVGYYAKECVVFVWH